MALKRCRIKIYIDILSVLYEGSTKKNLQKLTAVAYAVNLPYDRFQKCLNALIQFGLVCEQSRRFYVSEKGIKFLNEYRRFDDFLKGIGILH